MHARDQEKGNSRLAEYKPQIIAALARGNGNEQIARSPGISERTGRNHVSNIHEKLRVHDRNRAVLCAIREGLVELDRVKNC